MSFSPEISWNYLLNNPVNEWLPARHHRIHIRLVLDTLKENSKSVRWNPVMQQKAVQFLNKGNPSIYSSLIERIQNVIKTCGLAPSIYDNVKTNALIYDNNNNPSLLFLFSLSEQPSLLKSYRAIVVDDLEYLKNNHSDSVTCYTAHRFTPIHAAALFNRAAILVTLLEQATSPDQAINEKTALGWTPLMFAATNTCPETVNLLLDKGARLEETNNKGQTALMLASAKGHSEIVWLLMNRGANLEAKDENGLTALIMAAKMGYLGTVRLLDMRGANLGAKNRNNLSALTLATASGHQNVAEFLLAHIVNRPPAMPLPFLAGSSSYLNLPLSSSSSMPPPPAVSRSAGAKRPSETEESAAKRASLEAFETEDFNINL